MVGEREKTSGGRPIIICPTCRCDLVIFVRKPCFEEEGVWDGGRRGREGRGGDVGLKGLKRKEGWKTRTEGKESGKKKKTWVGGDECPGPLSNG